MKRTSFFIPSCADTQVSERIRRSTMQAINYHHAAFKKKQGFFLLNSWHQGKSTGVSRNQAEKDDGEKTCLSFTLQSVQMAAHCAITKQ